MRRRLRTVLLVLLALAALLAAGMLLLPPGPAEALANRMPETGLFGWPKRQQLYRLHVPPGASQLQFNFYGPGKASALDAYVRFGTPPTAAQHDAAATGPAPVKTISIASPQAGNYFLLVQGTRGFYARVSLVGSYASPGEVFKVGMHAHRLYNGGDEGGPPSPEPRFHYGIVRDWDISHMHDPEIWKADGSIDFSLVDRVYAAHARNGAKVVKTFGMVPTWAARRPQEPNPQYPAWPGAKSGPGNLDRYQDFVFRFVSHEKHALWAVEGWNEPYACPGDPPEFTTMTPTELADVQKRIYLAAKRADPKILVFSPAQAYLCGIPTILNARTSDDEPIWKYFDALAWHAYNRSAAGNAGPSFAAEAMQVRNYLNDAGLSQMPIVDTEHGWLDAPKEGGQAFRALTDAGKGKVLYDTARMAKSLGLLGIIWYGYDDDLIGRPMDSAAISAALERSYRDLDTH